MKIEVLDKGFVQYMNHMGTDRTVAEAAWVSMDSAENREEWEVERVIKYMARNNHWTPLAQVNLQLRIKMPIFVARQMMRSNIGIVWNEVSRRYVDGPADFYRPMEWRSKPEGSIKQGSGMPDPVLSSACDTELMKAHQTAVYAYHAMLKAGAAPEMARMVLPQSTYTEVVGNFTLAALARVYAQRVDSHAQWEIRQFSYAMGRIAKQYFPVSWEALTGGV